LGITFVIVLVTQLSLYFDYADSLIKDDLGVTR